MPLNKKIFQFGPLETTCTVLDNDKEAVVFDLGGDPAKVLKYLKEKNLQLTTIYNTHLHFDHTFGNAALAKATGATIMAGEADSYMLSSELGQGGCYGLPKVEPYTFTAQAEGETTILGSKCTVLSTPGHSPGSLSFYFPLEKILISGDVLFYRSVGRSDFPGGDGTVLVKTIREKLFTLPDDTVVYPGHGPETSIGYEKENNFFAK